MFVLMNVGYIQSLGRTPDLANICKAEVSTADHDVANRIIRGKRFEKITGFLKHPSG